MKTLKLFALTALLLCAACAQFDEPVAPNDETPATRSSVNATALRASAGIANVNNPYSLDNMEKAMTQYCKYAGLRPRPLSATHKYVRFQPKDSLEYSILEDSLSLELFSYPLDRNLSQDEIEFYSQDLIDGKSWQYTLVPKNFRFPTEVEYEILQDAYLQGTNPTTRANATSGVTAAGLDESLYDELVGLSMKNAGITVSGGGASTTSGYGPSATIKFIDDAYPSNHINYNKPLPLKGVKVRVNTFFNVGTAFTNDDGQVTIYKSNGGKFSSPVRYQVKFDNENWKIASPNLYTAIILGPKTTQHWNCVIYPEDRESSTYVAIHRALWEFYNQPGIYKPHYAFKRLVVQGLWNHSEANYGGITLPLGVLPLVPIIYVLGKYNGTGAYYTRHFILRTACHELGHASHQNIDIGQYAVISKKLRESYADAMDYWLLRKLYPDIAILDRVKRRYDSKNSEYTLIGEALIHQGLNMAQLQNTMIKSWSWNEWKENIKSLDGKPVVDWVLDFLFDNPDRAWDFNFVKESIIHGDSIDVIYSGRPTEFHLQEALNNVGAQAVRWFTNCKKYKLENRTSHSTNIIFDVEDEDKEDFELYVDVLLPTGLKYLYTRNIKVKKAPTMSGSENSRIGLVEKYTLDDIKFFEKWRILFVDTNGRPSDAMQKGLITLDKSHPLYNPELDVIFTVPGTYVISALIDFGETSRYVSRKVNISSEGNPHGNILAPGIYGVNTLMHKGNGSIIHQFYDKLYMPMLSDYYTLKNVSFRAFTELIYGDHPCAGLLKPIYEFDDYCGFKAYGNQTMIESSTPPYLIFVGHNHIFCYVLNKSLMGTKPLYSISMTVRNQGNNIVSQFHYLDINSHQLGEIIDFRNGFEGRVSNSELLGYVYPDK